jgi:glycosyltransferase involved in cell wall biosynthesis
MPQEGSAPRTTVVVPAYRAWATLPRTLAALEPQVAERGDRELILVESSGELEAAELEERWPWARIIRLPERTLPGAARNVGIAAARGDLVAFTDADAVPAPDWLDRLEEALVPTVTFVAGAIENGTPRSPIGTASYLLEFSEWLPGRRGDRRPHAATCNLITRRSWISDRGGFVEDVWPGEDTILTFPEGRDGRLRFTDRARVAHINRTRPMEFLRHQRKLGRGFVEVCNAVPFPHRWATRPALAPASVVLRLLALARRLPSASDWLRAMALLPLLLIGLVAWSVGVVERSREHP